MFRYHVNFPHNFYKLIPSRFYHNLFVHYMQKPLYVLLYGIIRFLYLLYFLLFLLFLFHRWDLIPFSLLILYLFLFLHLIDYDISFYLYFYILMSICMCFILLYHFLTLFSTKKVPMISHWHLCHQSDKALGLYFFEKIYKTLKNKYIRK